MASDGCCDWFFSVGFLKWLVFILNLLFSVLFNICLFIYAQIHHVC